MIYDITPFTTLDYPGKIASILWFSGCNMRCLYCYNPEIVFGENSKNLSEEDALDFLKKRVGLVDGVVFCGGEPTLYKNLLDLSRKIKEMGFLIKIDTNGTHPDVVSDLIANCYVDYIALDFKAPFPKYFSITNYKNINTIEESLDILLNSNIDYELRLTVHADLITEDDINEIIGFLDKRRFTKKFYIQNFVFGKTIGNLDRQKRLIDLSRIVNPKTFKIFFRNF